MIKVGDVYIEGIVPVGSKIKFTREKQAYTVRASNITFCICTKPFNCRKTVLYTIINWMEKVRGTENLVFGMGAETDNQCREMLERLTIGESEVSYRNRTDLYIDKFTWPKGYWKKGSDGIFKHIIKTL